LTDALRMLIRLKNLKTKPAPSYFVLRDELWPSI
jgi:hypothetical protein